VVLRGEEFYSSLNSKANLPDLSTTVRQWPALIWHAHSDGKKLAVGRVSFRPPPDRKETIQVDTPGYSHVKLWM
jgi:hypothetical protein